MFPSASIALTFLLALSGTAVQSAPLSSRIGPLVQGCSDVNGGGVCIDLQAVPGPALGPCVNQPDVQSLIMPSSLAECFGYLRPNCDANTPEFEPTIELFSVGQGGGTVNTQPGIQFQSFQCVLVGGDE
ncbi:hypothetical protein B0H17DRAFT_1206416 [Mycena rosella]|uniref:Uncharacterized protein n=1 Tax=Mycena rosella TaxID=1033263 RepID=A0AAD7D556_MYCRO|nr:hypothetical protein B0H17DRAFT_1206416 [Mycena rosella]